MSTSSSSTPNHMAKPPREYATAVSYITGRLLSSQRDPNCSTVAYFTDHDPPLDLRRVWTQVKQYMGDHVLSPCTHICLSEVSKRYLVINCERERYSLMQRLMNDAFTTATNELAVESEFEVSRDEETFSAPVAVVDPETRDPLIWCEIIDGHSYKSVLDRMMRVSSLVPTIAKFVAIHLYPTTGDKIEDYSPDFRLELQVFDRLTSLEQLNGRYSTWGTECATERYTIPAPDDRALDQNFDLVLVDSHMYEFTDVEGGPIYRYDSDSVLQVHLGEMEINVDVTPVLSTLQRTRDEMALRALAAFRKSPSEVLRRSRRRLHPGRLPNDNVDQVDRKLAPNTANLHAYLTFSSLERG